MWPTKELYRTDAGQGEVTLAIRGREFTLTPRDAREIARALQRASMDAERIAGLMESIAATPAFGGAFEGQD